MIKYAKISPEMLKSELFSDFSRRQEVKRCWRSEGGRWVVKDIAFIDDWDSGDHRRVLRQLAEVLKGGGAVFESAFIAKMESGHTGIFERITSRRLPIEEKMGLSAAQMVQNEVIMDQLTQEAQEKVDERLNHEIERILNGYGG